MIAQAQNAGLYAEWLTYIEAPEAREAFCYLVGRAAVLRSLECHPARKGGVRDVRFMNGQGEQPFSFISNRSWLLFYLRAPAIRSGRYTLQELSCLFGSAMENGSAEWTVRLHSMEEVRRPLDYLSLD
jgi:hypothetical protein